MTALGAEVIWTRLLSLLFGATVYTFCADPGGVPLRPRHRQQPRLDDRRAASARPRAALGWCQMLLCAAIAWAAYMLTESLPYWPINPSIATDPWFTFQLDLVRCLWVVLPGAMLWGASFPLALAAVATRGRMRRGSSAASTPRTRSARSSARSCTSFMLVVWLGSRTPQQVLIIVSALSALLMLRAGCRRRTRRGKRVRSWPARW